MTSRKTARVTLPIPKMDHPVDVHFPRPSPLPVLPTEAELERAERRLEQTQDRERSTSRPPGRGSFREKQNLRRTIHKLETAIESGSLKERDMYDAITNLHLLNHALKQMDGRSHTASQAFEHALLIQRIVERFLK
jgi:hypothetical protein